VNQNLMIALHHMMLLLRGEKHQGTFIVRQREAKLRGVIKFFHLRELLSFVRNRELVNFDP